MVNIIELLKCFFLFFCIFYTCNAINISKKFENSNGILDSNNTDGVLQMDQKGYSIKFLNASQGHTWAVNENPLGVNGPVSAYPLTNKDNYIPEYEGSNISKGKIPEINPNESLPKINNSSDQKQSTQAPPILMNKDGKIVEVSEEEVAVDYESNKNKSTTNDDNYNVRPPQISDPVFSNTKQNTKKFEISADIIKNDPQNELNLIGKAVGIQILDYDNKRELWRDDIPENEFPLVLQNPSQKAKIISEINKKNNLKDLPIYDPICTRDFSHLCPAGWTAITKNQCRANEFYKGSCPRVLKTEPMTAKEKRQLSIQCKVTWPCLNSKCSDMEGFDYDHPCPDGWTFKEKCYPPKDYNENCNYNLVHKMSLNEKELFAATCKVSWPCAKKACEQDYSIICPQDWEYQASSDTCVQLDLSKVKMTSPTDISKLTDLQRLEYSLQNGIKWPCKNQNNCSRKYSEPCPDGWQNIWNSGLCKAPLGYKPTKECPALVHFDFVSELERENFAKLCNANWICVGEENTDYSNCPENWKLVKDGVNKGLCEPTIFYHGPCKQPQNVLNMTFEMKKSFAEICSVKFSKINKTKKDQENKNILKNLLKINSGFPIE